MRRIAAILIYLINLTVQADSINLDSLLVKSIGGPEAFDSLKNLRSIHAEGILLFNGQEGSFSEYLVTPDKFYLEIRFSGVSLIQACDGWTAWQQDHNERPSKLSGFEQRELLKSLYFESGAYLRPDTKKGSVLYRGKTNLRGEAYHEVAFSLSEGDTVLVYYGLDDGLKELTVSQMDNMTTTTLTDDYRAAGGILFPFYSVTTAAGVPFHSEFTFTDIRVNEEIDNSIFAFPARKDRDFRFGGTADKIEIKIWYGDGHLCVPGTINGQKKVWFILDSGASANILHLPVARSLELPTVGSLPARGITGYEKVDLVRTDSISIGSLTLLNQVAGRLDMADLGRKEIDGLPFGGLLGYDFLSRFPVMIDYRNSTLTLFNPEGFSPPDGGTEIPFNLTMQVPTVSGELNGIPGEFIVDLGNAYGLILHREFVLQHRLEEQLEDLQDIAAPLGGIGGPIAARSAYVESFQIGEVLIESLRVIIPADAPGLAGSEELAGNIGNMVLESFRLLFDYSNNRLILYDAD